MLRSQIEDPDLFVKRFVELDAGGSVWKDEVYRILLNEFEIKDWSSQELLTSYELCFCGFCQPKTGAVRAVEELSKLGLKLGLISNGRSPFQERNFDSLGISDLFDTVIVSEAVGLRKPDRAIFELALQKLAVEAKETIFVGDNPLADITGSQGAGMYSIYIPGHYGNNCQDADGVCKDLTRLPDIIRQLDLWRSP